MVKEGLPTLGLQDALAVMDEEKTELDKVLQLLLDRANIEHNTELTRNEITAFSVLRALANQYDLRVLQNFINENLVFRVSKGRAGRKEWVKITSRHLAGLDNQFGGEENNRRGGFSRFFGRRR